MVVKLRIGSKSLEITPDDFVNWTCHLVLDEWNGFQCENSREDATGKNVLLVLRGDEESSPEEIGADAYQPALNWVIQNAVEIRDAAIEAIFKYVRETLLGEYQLDDPDLLRIKRKESLRNL